MADLTKEFLELSYTYNCTNTKSSSKFKNIFSLPSLVENDSSHLDFQGP